MLYNYRLDGVHRAPYVLFLFGVFSLLDAFFCLGSASTICTGHPCQMLPRSTSSPTMARVCSRRMESAPTEVPPMTRLSIHRVARSRMRMLFKAKAPSVLVCAMTCA